MLVLRRTWSEFLGILRAVMRSLVQAFFPDRSKWDKLARALGDRGVIDPGAFDALSGLVSLPFPRPPRLKPGEKWRVAVKVIDPRGNEGLRVKEV